MSPHNPICGLIAQVAEKCCDKIITPGILPWWSKEGVTKATEQTMLRCTCNSHNTCKLYNS